METDKELLSVEVVSPELDDNEEWHIDWLAGEVLYGELSVWWPFTKSGLVSVEGAMVTKKKNLFKKPILGQGYATSHPWAESDPRRPNTWPVEHCQNVVKIYLI